MIAANHRNSGAREPDGDHGPARLTPWSLLLVLLVFAVLTNLGTLVVSVLMALLLGTILEGPVQRLERRGLPRAMGITICYVGVILAIAGLVFVILPVIQGQATEFRDTFPAQMHELRSEWVGSNNPILRGPGVSTLDTAIDWLEAPELNTNVSGNTAALAIPIVGSVVTALTWLITTLVVTFYYVLEKKLVRQVVLDQISPNLRNRVSQLWTHVEAKVGGWLRGQLFLCFIIGAIATISYGLIGLNFWPLLGLWAGITEIIPIVGPWIGGVPAVLVALTMGPSKALLVAAIIVGMQSLENMFLVPRVMRGAVGLTPLTVFVAILAGTQLMGPIGAVLAIPIAAGLQVILTDFMDQRRARFEIEPQQHGGWRWMLGRALEPTPADTIVGVDVDYGSQVESEMAYPEPFAAEEQPPAAQSGHDAETPKATAEESVADESVSPEAPIADSTPRSPWHTALHREQRGT